MSRGSASLDAVVVGAGPNGLAAAITLARAGRSVVVLERSDTPGGGARTAALTLPGFVHDVCSAVHPLAAASPFFREVPLAARGCDLLQPDIPLAHPLDGGRVAVLQRDLGGTAAPLGADAKRWLRLFEPLVRNGEVLSDTVIGPPSAWRHPLLLAHFGIRALPSVSLLARLFRGDEARALLAGLGAHSFLPLEAPMTSAIALMLALSAHLNGWPVAKGGTERITDALAAELRGLGGDIRTGVEVRSLADVPASRAVLFDVTPRQLAAIARADLPPRYRRALQRYRYGPGVFKVDYALSGPVPWAAGQCRRAGTLHLGGTLEEIARSERAVAAGRLPKRPFVLVSQPSIVDPTRAPAGKQVLWAYCHVPNGSTVDMTEAIESQIERFAPGFRDVVLARHTMNSADYERYNPNCVGGDINGGLMDWRQLLTRPVARWSPYTTPNPRLFLCSASTPPAGGVHGMCGKNGAEAALRRVLR